MMLLEQGYKVVSCDASDKMLKTALEERWRRRKESAFDKWGQSVNNRYSSAHWSAVNVIVGEFLSNRVLANMASVSI